MYLFHIFHTGLQPLCERREPARECKLLLLETSKVCMFNFHISNWPQVQPTTVYLCQSESLQPQKKAKLQMGTRDVRHKETEARQRDQGTRDGTKGAKGRLLRRHCWRAEGWPPTLLAFLLHLHHHADSKTTFPSASIFLKTAWKILVKIQYFIKSEMYLC